MSKMITCFLVDDDKDDQEIFQLALNELGIRIKCVTADDGYLAMNLLNNNLEFIPEFIFLDLNMPRINGKQFLTMVKEIPRLKHVPVIVYTTSSRQYHKEEVFELGASGYITKPSDINELTRLLAEVFITQKVKAESK